MCLRAVAIMTMIWICVCVFMEQVPCEVGVWQFLRDLLIQLFWLGIDAFSV